MGFSLNWINDNELSLVWLLSEITRIYQNDYKKTEKSPLSVFKKKP